MVLGGGYDMTARESLPSPFDEVEAEESYSTDTFPQVDVQSQVFRDERELTNHLWTTASASSPTLSLASARAMASYIETVKCNSQNVCLVLRCTLSMLPEHFDNELDLSDTGRKLLDSSPEKFIECYGEYCIAGQIRQSSFFAVCTYSSPDAEELDKFTAALGVAKSGGTAGLDDTTDLVKGTKSHALSIKESHRFCINGVEGEIGLSWLEHATVAEAWQGFRFDYKPVPQVALLKHYSSILPGEITRPKSHHEISWDMSEAVWKHALLNMAARSKAVTQSATLATLDKISDRLDALSDSSNGSDSSEVKEILSKLDEVRDQLRKPVRPAIKAELQALAANDQKRCVEDEWSHGAGPWESCSEDVWQFGISPSRGAELGIATADIQTSTKTCQLPDTGALKTQKPDPIRIDVPGRAIIGAKLRNRYADPREGGKWKRVGGWLGRDTFSVKVETRHTRGCDWELTVWSVPQRLYEDDGLD
ncbi:hypothetical protein MBLNU13_g11161t1 [Cladosporium sp. NU13]